MKTGIPTASRILGAVALVVILASSLALAEEFQTRSTKDIKKDLKQTERELKSFQDLQRQLKSSGKDSSNSKRQKVIGKLREEMADCIIRREDILGQEHTIKMHGETVTSGTTKEAEAGAPVGTSSAKQAKNLNAKEGPNANRLRHLSRLQSIFVSAAKSERPAIEKQNDAFERYSDKMRRFEEELVRDRDALAAELDDRAPDTDGDETESGE
jgi:hypothetical protein